MDMKTLLFLLGNEVTTF